MTDNFVSKNSVVKANSILDIKSARRNLIITLIGSIVAGNSVVVFSDLESRVFFSSWTVNITLLVATGLAFIVMRRQKVYGLGKTYVSLVAGLALWLVAERISTYYEAGAGIDGSFPSFADVVRLSGYVFFAYHLFKARQFSSKSVIPYCALLSLSMLINAIAYGGSVYSEEMNVTGQIWIWDLLYNAAYLCLAVTLFWHNWFFIFKKKDQERSGGKMIINKPYVK